MKNISKKLLSLFVIFLMLFSVGCTNESVTTANPGPSEEYFPATIKGRVLSGAGDMVTAGIIITYPNGDMERVITNILSGYTLYLETGEYQLTFTRGMNYSQKSIVIEVENYKTYYIDDARLTKIYDSPSRGWYFGQLHQHSTFSDGKQGSQEVLISNLSTGLHFAYLTDHNTAAGLAEWIQGSRFVAEYDENGNPINFLAMRGVEVTTDYGHYQSLGVGNVLEQSDINPLKGDIPVDEISEIAAEIVRSGAIATINHPFAVGPNGFYFWEIADQFDAIEIWNGLYQTNRNENLAAKEKWFELLEDHRAGKIKFIAATAGSDNHDTTGYYNAAYADLSSEDGRYKDEYLRRGVYTDMPSLGVYIDGEFNRESIEDAIRNGNSYLSNGPRIIASINGAIYGETADINSESSVAIDIDLFSRDNLQELRIIKNGVIVKTVVFEDDINLYLNQLTIDNISEGDWIVLEVLGDFTAYAITNPIFIG